MDVSEFPGRFSFSLSIVEIEAAALARAVNTAVGRADIIPINSNVRLGFLGHCLRQAFDTVGLQYSGDPLDFTLLGETV